MPEDMGGYEVWQEFVTTNDASTWQWTILTAEEIWYFESNLTGKLQIAEWRATSHGNSMKIISD